MPLLFRLVNLRRQKKIEKKKVNCLHTRIKISISIFGHIELSRRRTISPSTPTALSISALNHFSSTQLRCFPSSFILTSPSSLVPSSASSAISPRRLAALAIPKSCRFRRISASAASGDDDSRRAGELSSLSSEVVVLNVEGMMCEGCADSVKKLLESRPQVSSASVNLTEKIATVWPAPEAKAESNWHDKLGGGLAEHLTSCGFKSSLQSSQEDSN